MNERIVSFPQKQLEGESRMITGDIWGMIRTLPRHGWSQRKIGRELDVDPKTVRRTLGQATRQPYHRRVTAATLLAGYEEFIRHRVVEVDYNAHRIFQELRTRGYGGGYDTVKLFVRPLRAERERLLEATRRFETAPGRQAQVDWGSTWAQIGERRVRIQIFVMVLGYSRRLYVECTPDQRLGTLLACHQHAFDWFGGLTEEILYDNPKTVVLKRDWQGRVIEWHPQFWDFARYYGFTPRLCRPYRAQTKGKVESGIKYVKRSFIKGRQFAAWEALNPAVQEWVLTIADQRVHGTTFRKPAELFAQEQPRSQGGRPSYRLEPPVLRTVARDCLVTVGTNRYSVPAAYVGKVVQVQGGMGEPLHIYYRGELIATHVPLAGTHQVQSEPAHYQGLWPRHAGPHGSGSAAVVEGLSLWPMPQDPVQVRDLAVYEALVN